VSDGKAADLRRRCRLHEDLAAPEVCRGALVLVAAAAGLVWALAPHGSSEDARSELALKSQPDTPKHSK
jgi:hypothetical protein